MKDLEETLELLRNDSNAQVISEKIDDVTNEFTQNISEVKSHAEFNLQISKFVRQIYKQCTMTNKKISSRVALGEAIDILERYFITWSGRGYDEAYLEAVTDIGKGIRFVLQKLGEFIKEKEITSYNDCLYRSIINPFDAESHRKIAEQIIEKYGFLFPDEIRIGNPVRFMRSYRELIETVIDRG